eukprot:5071507-Karenia_brevis.AAC.1
MDSLGIPDGEMPSKNDEIVAADFMITSGMVYKPMGRNTNPNGRNTNSGGPTTENQEAALNAVHITFPRGMNNGMSKGRKQYGGVVTAKYLCGGGRGR